jgi:ribonuclease P protein component
MFKFPKSERLCSKKVIQKLFENNNSFNAYPFKVLWMSEKSGSTSSVKVLISVSKKKIKKAVDRNLIRRRIKESYRLHKSELINSCINKKLNLSFILLFLENEIPDSKFINSKLTLIVNKLVLFCEKTDN